MHGAFEQENEHVADTGRAHTDKHFNKAELK
jgi:hypothetical protein